ncbi:MAG: pyridoxine 5'-phosphate synthase [Flavobacteriaceae bacterium]|nr:pyridoxine 5'-phosphate synthase [Flavobacteriaceae bacterium]
MSRLSVNINKIATLRNARGGDVPNVVQTAKDCERFGAEGITVHPRPDERHITRKDVYDLKKIVKTEFNIEGYPSRKFLDMVLEVQPEQVTLVPDPPEALTSNAGWDTVTHQQKLKAIIEELKQANIRTSIFVDTNLDNIKGALDTGTDRIEFYTEPYASNYPINKEQAITPFVKGAELAHSLGLGINAGHDLSLLNLQYFAQNIPNLKEVSIGHALIADALYLGLENTIQLYKRCLK